MKTLRVYADTSVYGGVFDDEFSESSQIFFEQVRLGYFQLIASDLVHEELKEAPNPVKQFFYEMLPISENTGISSEAAHLQEEYVKAGIVGPKWETDAMHVALATTSQCQILVSWNFKHLVNFKKITLYNEINTVYNYSNLSIHTPREVTNYEKENI